MVLQISAHPPLCLASDLEFPTGHLTSLMPVLCSRPLRGVSLQTSCASTPSSTLRTCRRSPNTLWCATWMPLGSRWGRLSSLRGRYPRVSFLSPALYPSFLLYNRFKYVIGIGVGAGAYVLAKFALIFPDLVEGLVLMNIDPNGKGWIDWAATKLSGLTSTLPDTVLSHLFSQEELVNNTELVQNYRQQISNVVNQANLQLFWNMYNSRRDLDINRPGTVPNAKTLRCPVMLVVGDNAPAEDGVVSVTPLRRRLRLESGADPK
ncbi:Protein NDRG4 [Microtus ochrogaster]|uniref:Protein NDRG4 n=1 Tax=Microtus ochrogaster TaxID=79684 RepID=A0A8J6KL49_MICOH|nr:Protein NDRG4 [Microtus ochrogaster]